jgi:hypothetical protein
MVHAALPPVDDKLAAAMAEGSQAYCKLVTTDPKYKRPKRRQVFIEKFEASYSTDVMATVEEMKGTQPSSGTLAMPVAAAPSTPMPGFAIRLIGRTPYEQATQFIPEAFLDGLQNAQEAGEKLPNVDVHFDGVQMIRINRLSEGHGMAIGGTGFTGGYAKTIGASSLDPLTNELTKDDWEFEVVFAAVLAPKPEAPPVN